jgi:hypothetical protein
MVTPAAALAAARAAADAKKLAESKPVAQLFAADADGDAEEEEEAAAHVAAGDDIQLYLMAAYAPGVRPPKNGVKLIADAILTKHVDCIREEAVSIKARPFGSQRTERPVHSQQQLESAMRPQAKPGRLAGSSSSSAASKLLELLPEAARSVLAPNLSAQQVQQQLWLHEQQKLEGKQQQQQQHEMPVPPEAKAVAADPPASAQCSGRYPLNAGLYSLLAASVEGADWAAWSCLVYNNNRERQAEVVTVEAAAMYSPGAVELKPGHTYTCIAFYKKATGVAIAATSPADWDKAVMAAADAAAKAATAETCPSLAYIPPLRGLPPPPLTTSRHKLMANGKEITIHGLNWWVTDAAPGATLAHGVSPSPVCAAQPTLMLPLLCCRHRFGFNVPMGVVDGLWAGGTDLATDFGKISYQLKLLGYNAGGWCLLTRACA